MMTENLDSLISSIAYSVVHRQEDDLLFMITFLLLLLIVYLLYYSSFLMSVVRTVFVEVLE